MSQFEFFMAFYGLLLGLGVAELLGGFANILRAKNPPRLGLIAPLIGCIVLIEMLANFVDAWVKFRDISISLSALAIPTLIGLIYFVVAVIVVPRDLNEWTNLDDYMATRRRWIAGFLIIGNLLILALEATRVGGKTEGGTSTSVLRWFIANGWLLGGSNSRSFMALDVHPTSSFVGCGVGLCEKFPTRLVVWGFCAHAR